MASTLAVIYGLIMIYVSATNRVKTHIRALSMQGAVLFLICYFAMFKNDFNTFIFLAFETIVIKTVVIPIFLNKVLREKNAYLFNDLRIPNIYSLIVTSCVIFASFLASDLPSAVLSPTTKLFLSVSLASIIISLFFITLRKKVLTSVIDYIMMENGIFLLSLSLSKEMPIIVELGVLLDVFIAVYILGFLINKVSETFDVDDRNALKMLKDSEDD